MGGSIGTQYGFPDGFASTCCERDREKRGDDLLARGSFTPRGRGPLAASPQRGMPNYPPAPISPAPICGIGMGFDASLLEARRGAVVACVEKNGPADRSGDIRIGDQVVYVDDLDIRELINNPSSGNFDLSKGIRPILAHYLHGDPGTRVRLGLIREGSPTIVHTEVSRAPLHPGCQWIVAGPDAQLSASSEPSGVEQYQFVGETVEL